MFGRWLHYVINRVRRETAQSPVNHRPRLPVTPTILSILYSVWSQQCNRQRDAKMFWAACCLDFFAFLRSGKFTVQPQRPHMPASLPPLSVQDIAVDNMDNLSLMTVHLKRSKTDQFGQG